VLFGPSAAAAEKRAAAVRPRTPHSVSPHDSGALGHDALVPDGQVAVELGNISLMTIVRYDADPAMASLGWPPPIRLKQRKYRSRHALEAFKAALIRRAVEQRRRLVEPAA
jgi:hypothetical protein